jgi:putative oxidoreductase
MKKLISQYQSVVLLRIGVSILMMAHGFQRLYYNTVNDFGEFLNAKGFLIGRMLAWSITIFELTGGLLMAIGIFTRWISLGWMVVITMGIVLVHAQNGWFVVGPSTGGVEYSVLLLLALIVIASREGKK